MIVDSGQWTVTGGFFSVSLRKIFNFKSMNTLFQNRFLNQEKTQI